MKPSTTSLPSTACSNSSIATDVTRRMSTARRLPSAPDVHTDNEIVAVVARGRRNRPGTPPDSSGHPKFPAYASSPEFDIEPVPRRVARVSRTPVPQCVGAALVASRSVPVSQASAQTAARMLQTPHPLHLPLMTYSGPQTDHPDYSNAHEHWYCPELDSGLPIRLDSQIHRTASKDSFPDIRAVPVRAPASMASPRPTCT